MFSCIYKIECSYITQCDDVIEIYNSAVCACDCVHVYPSHFWTTVYCRLSGYCCGSGCTDNWETRIIQNSTLLSREQKKKLFVMYIIYIHIFWVKTFCLRKQSVRSVSTDDFCRSLGTELRYLPPLSLVTSNLLSCADNPQTGKSAHGWSRVHCTWAVLTELGLYQVLLKLLCHWRYSHDLPFNFLQPVKNRWQVLCLTSLEQIAKFN